MSEINNDKIKATVVFDEENAVKVFHHCLCNLGDTFPCSGLMIDWDEKAYQAARKKLKGTDPCLEDVLMQVLRDGELRVVDQEGEGEYNRSLTFAQMLKRIGGAPIFNLSNVINEDDDANDAFCIMQHCFFEEQVFG